MKQKIFKFNYISAIFLLNPRGRCSPPSTPTSRRTAKIAQLAAAISTYCILMMLDFSPATHWLTILWSLQSSLLTAAVWCSLK